jgi:serine/threonine-protein kinase
MRLGTSVWTLGKFFVIVGALGATFLLFFVVSLRVALWARQVQVPELVGGTASEATVTLAPLGLGLRVDENERPDDRIAEGRIVMQDPPAGAASRRQRTIRVWLSSGPRTTVLPALVGQSERAARVRLRQDDITVASTSEFRSADYAAGTVVSQRPDASVPAGEVSLLVNRGEQTSTYLMPDVIGVDGERAADALRRLGFRVSIVGTQP